MVTDNEPTARPLGPKNVERFPLQAVTLSLHALSLSGHVKKRQLSRANIYGNKPPNTDISHEEFRA